ncbi:hypothetical protein FIA58_010225 [Flavobacterium jejuense]|uniref:DUF1735 domain-containing protein n=1 Tax=Flavobacterium jejuense TaxID=1544455 RepID=A0ABX0IVE6_9FLAO|nr:hypothetical protein [Flavobacterium jejuense]NHN26051.1 hypothetical protein [Flavobacterium jejuense]
MKNIKILLITLVASALSISCLVDDEIPLLESTNATTLYTVGFQQTNKTANVLIDGTGSVESYSLPVDLLSGQEFTQTPSITVTYEVDPSSTAVLGTHYNITSGNSVNIPADRDFGTIDFSFDTNNLDVNDPRTVVINLLTSSNGSVAEQFKKVTLTIQGVCPSDYAGVYTCPQNISSTAPIVNITEIAPNVYNMDAMPYIALGGSGGSPAFIEFSEVCGVVQWGSWQGDTLAEGDGTIDPITGVITFNYLRIYNGNVADPNDIWFDLGPSTFTPN